MNSLSIWIAAARPKTLWAGIAPVIMGSMLALIKGPFSPLIFVCTLLTALGIQIATNFANDYFDFLKGADTKERKGPLRVTQAGLVSLSVMKRAVILCLSFTALSGLYLVIEGGIVIGCLLLLSLVLAVLYTAGPCSLAYLGLGDIFVLVFFGPVAVAGTCFLQTGRISSEGILCGLAVGAISTAILCINNLRDVVEDAKAGKKTLAVRFGVRFTKIQYLICLGSAGVIPFFFLSSKPYTLLSLLFFYPAFGSVRTVFSYGNPKELNPVLGQTGKLLILYTALFCIGLIL